MNGRTSGSAQGDLAAEETGAGASLLGIEVGAAFTRGGVALRQGRHRLFPRLGIRSLR